VKRLFTLRLAHVPRQGEPVRARWERDATSPLDRATDAEWALAQKLAEPDWRLVVSGEKDGKVTAEITHEVLFKAWPTLKHWLEDEREFLIWRGELEARRKEYEKAGKEGLRKQRQALLMLHRFLQSRPNGGRACRYRSSCGSSQGPVGFWPRTIRSTPA
jgi:hypothetical protein